MFGNLTPAVAAYVAGWIAFVLIRGRHDRGRVAGSQPYGRTLTELAVMASTALGMMVLPVLFVVTPWLDALNYEPWAAVQAAGIGVLLPGLWLFRRAHVDLGRHFSRTLEIHPDHALVTSGVYQRIRHPIYAAIFLIALAQGLLLPNWLAGPSGLVGFAAMYFARVRREEAMMQARFGPAYARHVAATGRLVPRLSSKREAEPP